MHLFSLTSCLHFLLFDLVWSLVPFLVIKLLFKRPERLIYWRRIPSHSGRAGCSLTLYPAWALWIVSVTVIVPLAVDVDMTWIILKSLERSWVCPFPGQPVHSSEIPRFGTVLSHELDAASFFGCGWLCLGWWHESRGWDTKEPLAGFGCPSIQSLVGWNCRLPHSPSGIK